MSFAGQEKAVLTVSRGASHFNFHSFYYFLIHVNTEMTAGWRTHLLRFHGERPYHVRVESQVVVSLGASEFCLPLKVGEF